MHSILVVVSLALVSQVVYGADCPAYTPKDLSKIYGPANDEANGAKTCPRGFCRLITTSFGTSNACVDQEELCPSQTIISGPTVLGPADNDLMCPQTTHCVSGPTDNGFAGNFCVQN